MPARVVTSPILSALKDSRLQRRLSATWKETNHAHETRLFRVIPPQMGKSLFAPDCVVADAVVVEPVSQVQFPANSENNREF